MALRFLKKNNQCLITTGFIFHFGVEQKKNTQSNSLLQKKQNNIAVRPAFIFNQFMITVDFPRRRGTPLRLRRLWPQDPRYELWTRLHCARAVTIVFQFLESEFTWACFRQTSGIFYIFINTPQRVPDPPVAHLFGPETESYYATSSSSEDER